MIQDKDNLYRSANLGLNAYLMLRECVPIKFECERGRVVFCFTDRERCSELARDFFSQKCKVEPMTFAFNVKSAIEMRDSWKEKFQ